MLKKIMGLLVVLLLIVLSAVSIHQHNEIKEYKSLENVLENKNVKVKYEENDDGTYEIYVDLKHGQKISEAPVSSNKDSVLIAPDIK